MDPISSLLENYGLTAEDCSKPVGDIHLEELSQDRCDKWRFLPPHLGLSKTIKKDVDRMSVEEREKRHEFLTRWKEKKGSNATYGALINGLLKIGSTEDAEFVCQLIQQQKAELAPTKSSSSYTQLNSAAGPSSFVSGSTLQPDPAPSTSASVAAQPADTVPKVKALKRNEDAIVDSLENMYSHEEAMEIEVVPQDVKKRPKKKKKKKKGKHPALDTGKSHQHGLKRKRKRVTLASSSSSQSHSSPEPASKYLKMADTKSSALSVESPKGEVDTQSALDAGESHKHRLSGQERAISSSSASLQSHDNTDSKSHHVTSKKQKKAGNKSSALSVECPPTSKPSSAAPALRANTLPVDSKELYAVAGVCQEVKALKRSEKEKEIVDCLENADLVRLCGEAVEIGVVPQDVKKNLDSMDWENVPRPRGIRYLLMHVYRSIEENSRLCERWIQVLLNYVPANILDKVQYVFPEPQALPKPQVMSKCFAEGIGCAKLIPIDNSDPVSDGITSRNCSIVHVISLKDISKLTKKLGPVCACKWESICTVLGLPENVRHDLRITEISYGCSSCFTHLLMEWISGKYEHAKAPTLENLKAALRSEIVGRSAEVEKLEGMNFEAFSLYSDEQPPLPKKLRTDSPIVGQSMGTVNTEEESTSEQPPLAKKPRVQPLPLEIVRQSYDIVVPEGKSTLLEVQVATSQDSDVHYQWVKDRCQVSNGRHNSILCVSHSSLFSEGTYKCEVTIHDGSAITVSSQPVTLKVSVSKIKADLVRRYLSESEVPEDSWPPVSSNTYINLALIKQGNIDKAGEYARKTIQGNMDDILTDKESIDYEKTFTDLESATCLLIEGRPGSGKTTLVHKFSQDWARGNPQLNLHNIKLLFMVHLRGFFNDQNIKLRDIVKLYYTKESVVDTITAETEENNGEGFCFILDGLDEYRPNSIKNTFISKLIKRQVLPMAIVIIASRPAASCQFRSVASKQIEVLGFMKEQIFEYVEKYPFSEVGKKSDLHKYLEHHPNVHHMCYLPIHAAMVCYLFDILGNTLPRTETEMYKIFTNLTLYRTLKRDAEVGKLESVEDLPDQEKELFFRICKLSYVKTLSSKQAMKGSEVKDFFKEVNSGRQSLGLITVDRKAKICGFENLYTFLHLTFQEYLAAYHLFKGKDEKDQMAELKKHGKKKHMQVVWKFYCGLALFSESDANFGEIMKCSCVNEDSLFGVQCAFESQQTVPCDYVVQSEECGTLSFKGRFLTPSDLTAIGYVLRNTTCPVEKFVLDRCKLGQEGVNAFLAEAGEKITSVKTLCFHGKDCKMEQFQLLNICLQKMISIEVLDLSKTNLGSKKIKDLTSKHQTSILPNLHTLKLSSLRGLDKQSLRLLRFDHLQLRIIFCDTQWDYNIESDLLNAFGLSATFLSSMRKVTTQVKLCNHNFQITDLADGLSSFTSLDLTNCGIGDSECETLMNGLVHCSALIELVLGNNKISDDGAIKLSKVLGVFTQLESLDISANSVGAAGMAALAGSIIQCTLLQKLDVSYNSIGDTGATFLAKTLRHLTQVKVLKLAFTKMGDKGAISLAEVLKHCDKIEDLSMDGNSIGDKGVLSLASGISHCTGLHKLVLSYNHIGDMGAKSLAESFTQLQDITELDLSYNKVGDEGAIAITRAISHLKGLKLRIWNHRISKEGSSHIAGLIRDVDRSFHHLTLSGAMLQRLDILLYNMQNDGIESNHITDIKLDIGEYEVSQNGTLLAIFNYCTELQTLNATLSNLDVNSAYLLTQVLPKCTELKLHTAPISNIKEALAVTLIHCNNIQALNFSNASIGADGAKALAVGLQHCGSLQTLNLENNHIGADGAKALAEGLQHCSSLQTLNLENNSIGADGAKALAEGLQHYSNLQTLNLHNNGLKDDGAKALAEGLQHCSSLQTLNLHTNGLKDDGAKALAVGLQHCSSLQTLNLENNSISANGAKALTMGLQHCSSLQTLNLRNNSIGDDGAKALAEGLQHYSNLQTLNLHNNGLKDDGAKALAEGLQHCSSLQTLNLDYNSIGADGAKALAVGLQHCSSLQTLNLDYNSIGADGAKALAVGLQHCSSLQTLNLDYNSIGADGAKALAVGLQHCSSLQTLNLHYNGISADGAKALAVGLQHCSSLQTLNLWDNKIGADGAKALAVGLQHCSSLQTLNLWYNKIGADGTKALTVGLQHCSSLQALDLDSNSIGADGAKALAVCLQHCSSLQTLNLDSNSIGADGAKALAVGLQHCSSLQTLDLDSNSIGADGAKALAVGLQHCSSLQALDLDSNSIGADGAKALAVGLQHCSSLQTLNLDSNSIGADGAKALAVGLQHCSSLQTLNLHYNGIGADGAKALAVGLQHCSSLQTLNLHYNGIGADGAKALAVGLQHCSSLRTLDLRYNRIDDDGAKALTEGLPGCKIIL